MFLTRGQNFQTSMAVYYKARPVFEEAIGIDVYTTDIYAIGFEDPGFLNYGLFMLTHES